MTVLTSSTVVLAFAYLYQPATDGSSSVTVFPYGRKHDVLETHPLYGVKAESAERAHTLVRKHEGNGRKPSFHYTPYGCLYFRSFLKGRPVLHKRVVPAVTAMAVAAPAAPVSAEVGGVCATPPAPVKRGPGRPRKVVAAEDATTAPAVPAATKRRARKAKPVAAPVAEVATTATTEPVVAS